jgi:hypothetical protein
LNARGEVGCFTQRELLHAAACADITDHDEPGVNADADLERLG